MDLFSTLALLSAIFSLTTHVYGHTFASATEYNICGKLYDVGYGPGRVAFSTREAKCKDEVTMNMDCRYISRLGQSTKKDGEYTCEGEDKCFPSRWDFLGEIVNDAGCLNPPKALGGTKGQAATANHACSAGLNVGDEQIYIQSSITVDNPKYEDLLQSCKIIQDNPAPKPDRIIVNYPTCDDRSHILLLKPKTTYQACIDLAVRAAVFSVGFTWHISSPGNILSRRDSTKPLSEMFTINNSTSDNAVKIVVDL
ncbi:hypothetical protein FKW77_007782 [Venturia effusa]|uniref:Secreted protein n=1 Tax=Venturia effusa TaxID=50376 RepID=A0A517L9M3_9PEZI|nr:hypothetical protein FKW77_007782 [Venturia effusa]